MASDIHSRLGGARSSLAFKAPCRVATTANITLSGTQTIDGVAVVAEDRVLVKDQTTGSQNGIYLVKALAWERDRDFDGADDVVDGTRVYVHSGTTENGAYVVTTDDPITIGTSTITFARATTIDLGDAPELDAINLGHPSDTTLTRSSAGRIAVENVDLALDQFTQAGTGAQTVTVQQKQRQVVSVLDFIPQSMWASIADGSNTTALDNYLTAAMTASNDLTWPRGTYLVAGPITVASTVTWTGYGATIKQTHTARAYVLPLLISGVGSEKSSYEGLTFDHNASGVAEPSLAAATAYAYLCAILTWDDDVVYTNCVVLNAWDSGFTSGLTVVSGSGAGGSPITVSSITNSEPQRVRFINCRAHNCGVGVHSLDSNQQVGGGFNVLNGSRTLVSGCLAYECSTGFIADYGAGAGATFTACVAVLSKLSSGWGFWLGSGPVNVSNCSALYCQADGFVVPSEANGVTLNGCYAFSCGQDGFYLASNKFSAVGCLSQDNSQTASGTYSGFHVNSAGEAIDDAVFSGCVAIGSTHKYGLEADGANTITGQWFGGSLNGATAAYSIGTKDIAVVAQKTLTRNIGFNVATPASKLAVGGSTSVYSTTAVGDTGNGGVFQVVDATTPTKLIAFGYDATTDAGIIQAIQEGVAKKPLLLNPSGGEVSVGAALLPVTSDGGALGSTTKMFADLFLALGGVINFNTGDVTITHSANTLTIAGGITALDAGSTIGGSSVYVAGGTDVPVADGGTGRSTSTTAYGLIAAGTTATAAHQTLAAGATTEILVGGGAAALPAWTAATGTGAPVRATSPILTTPQINDTSADHQYIVAVSELTANRTVTFPLLTGNDTFVFANFAATLANKTLTSPVINTGTVGTSLLPTSNDGAALGAAATAYSDLFLASGGVINWNNGTATLTQSGANLTLGGGGKFIIQGTSGAEGLNINATGGTKFFTFKPETAVDQAQVGYWVGANWGTVVYTGSIVGNSGKWTPSAPTTSYASLNLLTGAAPSSPVDGDLWREDNTNTGLKIRVNGVTKTITLA